MTGEPSSTLPRRTLAQIIRYHSAWVGLSFMWNSLHVIILPAVLIHLVPVAQKNTYLGLLTLAGYLIAMFVQPVSGMLSDRWASRWGRRRPMILVGTLFDFIFLAVLGWAGGIGWVALGYIGLQLSSNTAQGPLQGLLPDLVPADQLGWASGFKNLMDMTGLVLSTLLVGRLLDPQTRHPVGVIAVVAAVLGAATLVTLLGAREQPVRSVPPAERRPAFNQAGTFQSVRRDLSLHPNYWWLIASRFAFLAGIYGIQAFAQYYVRDVLAVPNPIQLTGDLLATITLALMVFAVGGGWLGDRIGHRRMLVIASATGALGCLLLLWARTPQTLLAFGAIVGVGVGLFLTSNWALANAEAPLADAGRFLGLTNLATAGAGVLGRLQGPLIDTLNSARPGAWWGYILLFLVGAAAMLTSALLLRKVPAVPRQTAPTAAPSK